MGKLKIHIVEDEIIIAYDLQYMLEDLGYIVNDISASVEEALIKLELDNSNLFLLDINLKGEKSGFELGNLLSELDRPFIYMSSIKDKESLEKARKHIFLEKPFDIHEIDIAINSVINCKDE